MNEAFLRQMTETLRLAEELSGCDVVQAGESRELPFPMSTPRITVGLEEADRLDYFLGYDECLVSGEKLYVSVMCDEQSGSMHCEAMAKQVCRIVLDADLNRNITSVSVEKCMYDKANFAYKVIMRFVLREQVFSVAEEALPG